MLRRFVHHMFRRVVQSIWCLVGPEYMVSGWSRVYGVWLVQSMFRLVGFYTRVRVVG
jgi:hypothetical protein